MNLALADRCNLADRTSTSLIATPKVSMLVAIASNIENPEVLIAGVQPGTEVLLLQDSTDSISQISAALAVSPAQTLSIVCHGSSGKLDLGKTLLDRHSLPKYQQQLQAWGISELVLYACEVGQDRDFIAQLSEHTGAKVAAAKGKVGNAALGGNWQLEDGNGEISETLAFSDRAIKTYAGILVSFSPQTTFAAGTLPRVVAVGDFNSDGKLDLATANFNDNNVSVLLGNGSGGFSAQTTFAAGTQPFSVAVGDFNGDGKPDLAVANFIYPSFVSVLLGNGSGGFSAQTTFAAGVYPNSVAVGDFNSDGKLDLATANRSSNNASVLLGNGSGGFSAPANFAVGANPFFVAVGDFNSDSKPDLAVANFNDNNVSVLLGNGSGGFSAQTTFAAVTQPDSVAVGDFNGDSRSDLAVTGFVGSNNLSVLLGNGSGGFSAPTNFTVGSFPYSVAVGDFDSDGKSDLATANISPDNVSVLLGNGSGSFSAPANFAVGDAPRSVAVGDFNGDGKPDLATGNSYSNNISVLLNRPSVNLSVSTNAGTEAGTTVVTVTATASFAVTGNQTVNLGVTGTGITAGDYTLSNTIITIPNGTTTGSVTFTVVNDALVEGTETATLTISSPSAGIVLGTTTTQNIAITDNDTAGITVTPTSGLVTTEAGGTANFTVVLTSQPTADVIIPISSNDLTEGTASPTSLTFTSANFNTPQTVTVTGVDDLIADGNIAYNILTGAATSSDANYNNFNAADVAVTNNDNDIAGITVNPTSGLITTEAGGTATFSVVLTSQPTADVIIPISSSDPTEGTASPAPLTFTALNWNTPQTVTVTGVDDLIVDGNIAYNIITGAATSADTNYNNFNPADVAVTNNDNDVVGVTVTPTSGLVTTEAGGTATFSVVLTSQPTADVTIPISSSDPTEGTASPAPLTFTALNWNTPQTVTVTGVDDLIVDGNIAYNILTGAATSSDANYNNFNAADVAVTNNDNDSAGFTITPINGLITTEAGGTANFSVKLTAQPTANVTLNLSSSNTAEGTISTPSLTFTPANFNTAQLVTVTGVNDLIVDGNIAYTIITTPAVSADLNYNGLNPTDVSVTNNDNDIAQVTTPGTTVIPSGGSNLILGTNIANVIFGNATNDTIYGYAGNDYIAGQNGADYIDGGIDNDILLGEAGNDTILGGAGNDTLIGGLGVDSLIGGADIDTFVYNAIAEGGDAIADFAVTEKFLVSQGGFGGGLLPGILLASQFGSGAGLSAAANAAQRFIYDTTSGILRFDADGSGVGASSIVATLSNKPVISSSNIQVF